MTESAPSSPAPRDVAPRRARPLFTASRDLLVIVVWFAALVAVSMPLASYVRMRADLLAPRPQVQTPEVTRPANPVTIFRKYEWRDVLFFVSFLLVPPLVPAAGAYVTYGLIRARELTLITLVRHQRTNCLWATPTMLAAIAVDAVWCSRGEWSGSIIWCTWGLVLVIGPILLAREERRRRLGRRARWRPVCPECDYSIRKTVGATCPECGEQALGDPRRKHDWAVRRLEWERRRERQSLPFAYIRTLLFVLVCPCRAGARVVHPDRWGRLLIWLLVPLVGAVALWSAGNYLGFQLATRYWAIVAPGSGSAAAQAPEVGPAWTSIAIWGLQKVVAYGFLLGSLPLTAWLLLWLLPIASNARRALTKWTAYALGVLGPIAMLGFLFGVVERIRMTSAFRAGGRGTPWLLDWLGWNTDTLIGATLVIFAVWWARGASANPLVPVRGWRTLLGLVGGYVLLWLTIWLVLFNPGILYTLL